MTVKKRTISLDWEDLRFALALARSGKLSAAARELGVTHATVARRIDRLEESLGKIMFERRKDGYRLTEIGRLALGPLDRMDRAAFALLLEQAATRENTVLRLTTARSLAEAFLIERLDRLHRELPGLTLEVIGEPGPAGETDLALRFGPPTDASLTGKRIGWVGFGFYASTAYLKGVADGEKLQLISYDRDNEAQPEARWLAEQFPGIRIAFRANGLMAQAAAARSGFGIAVLPHYLAKGLSRTDLDIVPPRRELWLLRRADGTHERLIRLVADKLAALFENEPDLFS